jgi:hypothetical protein
MATFITRLPRAGAGQAQGRRTPNQVTAPLETALPETAGNSAARTRRCPGTALPGNSAGAIGLLGPLMRKGLLLHLAWSGNYPFAGQNG